MAEREETVARVRMTVAVMVVAMADEAGDSEQIS
jgi:hypothetical protein